MWDLVTKNISLTLIVNLCFHMFWGILSAYNLTEMLATHSLMHSFQQILYYSVKFIGIH
jgi:hypothetical protein